MVDSRTVQVAQESLLQDEQWQVVLDGGHVVECANVEEAQLFGLAAACRNVRAQIT